jgi:RNA polymerase sigma-70 factor, ECF subfamily
VARAWLPPKQGGKGRFPRPSVAAGLQNFLPGVHPVRNLVRSSLELSPEGSQIACRDQQEWKPHPDTAMNKVSLDPLEAMAFEKSTSVSQVAVSGNDPEAARSRLPAVAPFTSSVDSERERDAQLMGKIAAGEEAALAELYRQFAPILLGLALKMTGDKKEAEEILQEGFIDIWRKAAAYNSSLGSAFAWTVTVVRNKAIDRLRCRRRGQQFVERVTVEFSHSTEIAELSVETPVWSERRGIVLAALAQISEEQREALELTLFSGLTHEEIARQLGKPVGTVKAWIRCGLIFLRNLVKQAQ